MSKVRFVLCVVLAFNLGLSLAEATPFCTHATGYIDVPSWQMDEHHLDGAFLDIKYSAESTTPPTATGVTGNYHAWSEFNCFTMEVNITQRPGGAASLHFVSDNDPIAGNYFAPSTQSDDFWFDGRGFNVTDESWNFYLSAWGFNFGTQDFLAGYEAPMDLSFWLNRPPDTTIAQAPSFNVGFMMQGCSLTEFAWTSPEPASSLLLFLGAMAAWRRKRS